jgi:hypothetical protein
LGKAWGKAAVMSQVKALVNKVHREAEEQPYTWRKANYSGGSAQGIGRGTGVMNYKEHTNGRSCWGDSGLYNGGGDDMGDCDLGGRGFD